MKYEKLTIDNFRCFRHFEVTFANDVSIIIGKNGAGKTSLIKAMVYSLYFMFTNDRSLGDDFLAAGNPDLKMKSPDFGEFYRNLASDEIGDVNLHGEMTLENEQLRWDMYRRSTPGSALYPSRYKEAYHKLMSLYRSHMQLPVIAFFSDSFPHRQTNISPFAKDEMRKGEQTLRNFGYYQWDNDTACTTIWQQRLANALIKDKMLDGENSFNHAEVEYVVDKLRKFSRPLHENSDNTFEIEKVFVSFNSKEDRELWLKLKTGEEIPFEGLPTGYHRLYSIVLDLAYRSFLLNRNVNAEPYGCVLIDEIDLHLHPSLAVEVVDRLRKLFPKIQYIMTSHSPLVITNLPHENGDNKILRMVKGDERPHVLPDIYGIDYDAAVRDVMEVTNYTEEDITFLKSSILRALRMNDVKLAEMRKNELKLMVGDNRYDKIMNEIVKVLNQ